MDDFFTDMQKIAGELIGEFAQGSPVYVSVAQSGGRPDRPGTTTETDHPIDATSKGVDRRFVDGSHIVSTDLQITMPATGVTPDMTGYIRVGTKRYKIIAIMTVPPIGTPVVHHVIFRG